MTDYEELHAEIKLLVTSGINAGVSHNDIASAAIMKIHQKLQRVTPEMRDAYWSDTIPVSAIWLAMLSASPLVPK